MLWPRTKLIAYSLLFIFVVGAPCCGSPCSRSLLFEAPVPDMSLAVGEATSYELFKNVWTLSSYCDGGTSFEDFPVVEVINKDPAIATARLMASPLPDGEQGRAALSLLQVEALAPGQIEIVLRTRVEVDCEDVLDATHFTVTVSPTP